MQSGQEVLALSVGDQAQNHAFCLLFDGAIDMQNVFSAQTPGRQEIIIAQGAADYDDFIFDQQMSILLKGLREKTYFETARVVVQNDGDAIASFSDVHNEAGNRQFAAGLRIISLAVAGLRCRFRTDVP